MRIKVKNIGLLKENVGHKEILSLVRALSYDEEDRKKILSVLSPLLKTNTFGQNPELIHDYALEIFREILHESLQNFRQQVSSTRPIMAGWRGGVYIALETQQDYGAEDRDTVVEIPFDFHDYKFPDVKKMDDSPGTRTRWGGRFLTGGGFMPESKWAQVIQQELANINSNIEETYWPDYFQRRNRFSPNPQEREAFLSAYAARQR